MLDRRTDNACSKLLHDNTDYEDHDNVCNRLLQANTDYVDHSNAYTKLLQANTEYEDHAVHKSLQSREMGRVAVK